MEDFTLKNWPGKQRGDLADVYVALNGESFSEAVTTLGLPHGSPREGARRALQRIRRGSLTSIRMNVWPPLAAGATHGDQMPCLNSVIVPLPLTLQ